MTRPGKPRINGHSDAQQTDELRPSREHVVWATSVVAGLGGIYCCTDCRSRHASLVEGQQSRPNSNNVDTASNKNSAEITAHCTQRSIHDRTFLVYRKYGRIYTWGTAVESGTRYAPYGCSLLLCRACTVSPRENTQADTSAAWNSPLPTWITWRRPGYESSAAGAAGGGAAVHTRAIDDKRSQKKCISTNNGAISQFQEGRKVRLKLWLT